MEIIKEFGFDPLLLGAQIVNFLVIFFILKKFVFKPVLEVLRNRENTIREGLKDAEEGQRLLEKAQEKEKLLLKNARLEAEQILSDAKKQAVEEGKTIEERSRKEAEELIKNARAQIEQDSKEAEKTLALRVSDIAVSFLEKSLSGLFEDSKQKELVQIAIKKMEKNN